MVQVVQQISSLAKTRPYIRSKKKQKLDESTRETIKEEQSKKDKEHAVVEKVKKARVKWIKKKT